MSKDESKTVKQVARDLPMPKYQYQRPSETITYRVTFNEQPKQPEKDRLEKAVATLQHAKF